MAWQRWFRRKPTETEFVRDLLEDQHCSPAWAYDPRAHSLTQSDRVVNLLNIHAEYCSAPRAARRDLLTKYRALMWPDKVSSLWSFAQTRIYPLVRSKYDRVALEIDRRREGGRLSLRAAQSYLSDLELVVGYDCGATVMQVPVDMVVEWGVSISQALDRALVNLKSLPEPIWQNVGNGVWRLYSEGSYNESFLQWAKTFETLPVKGEVLAAVPSRGVLLASTVANFNALADAVQKALQELPWPLSGAIFHIVEGKLQALASKGFETRLKSLANLSLLSVYNTQQAALRLHCEAIDEAVFVATFALLSPQGQAEQFQSWCSWTEGVESLLPKTDLIAFVRTATHGRKTLLVSWPDVTAVVGAKMLETSEDPARIQVDEFPDEKEWAELEKCATVLA